jgi:hypothetical protein
MQHVMLDLETLGTAPGSVILSIGAVAFDTTCMVHSFDVHIDPRSCQQAGLTLDADTVLWWMGRSGAARDAVVHPLTPPVPIAVALQQFTLWFCRFTPPVMVWSKGPSFDAAILAAAYRACDLPVPWNYRDERCVRTVLALAGMDHDTAHFRQPEEVRHDALADAMTQTRAVQEALRRLGIFAPP